MAVVAKCGGVIQATATPQYIKSPGYDTRYKCYNNMQECSWIIKVSEQVIRSTVKVVIICIARPYTNYSIRHSRTCNLFQTH